MAASSSVLIAVFLATSSFVLLVSLLVTSRQRRLESRLLELSGKGAAGQNRELVNQFTKSALPRLGAAFAPKENPEQTLLASRLLHAGYYSRQALALYLGVKTLLVIVFPIIGILAAVVNVVPTFTGLAVGGLAGGFGLIGPSFWLDHKKRQRQTILRRSLPDALDVLIICMEGGLSFTAALARVVGELRMAHPLLGAELAIVEREIQLGYSSGEALRLFGTRTDLEELRSLAAVVLQTERYGASLVKALRVHSESLRIKRMQHAEEMAQKAVVKVLIPTILCIFPAMFLVILGPAVIQIFAVIKSMGAGGLGLPPVGP
jgi:tight adherence protein C